jgi:hypothetical protein
MHFLNKKRLPYPIISKISYLPPTLPEKGRSEIEKGDREINQKNEG